MCVYVSACLENRSCFEYRMHIEGGAGLYRQCLLIHRAIKIHSHWGRCDKQRFRPPPPPPVHIYCTSVVTHTGLHINTLKLFLLFVFLPVIPCFYNTDSLSVMSSQLRGSYFGNRKCLRFYKSV